MSLSLVICSRNDSHGGNATWRLQTTLNYAAFQAARLGCLDSIEVIVTDWGSSEPLRNVVRLSADAARVTRFLEVSPALAEKAQRDSPFAEVVANNAAIRRAAGTFIGRIDQDTLVGGPSLERFLAGVREGGDALERWSDAALFAGRRSIPESYASETPPFGSVVEFVDAFGPVLPREGLFQAPWFDAPVGIVALHRDLWDEYRGYDERLLYWGFMESDLCMRVDESRRICDLGAEIGTTFYHLAHTRAWFAPTQRRMNPRQVPAEEVPNGEGWGLVDDDLPMRQAEPASLAEGGLDSKVRSAGAVSAEWVRQSVLAAARVGRRVLRGDRVEPAIAEPRALPLAESASPASERRTPTTGSSTG